jgi:hypothetical protein
MKDEPADSNKGGSDDKPNIMTNKVIIRSFVEYIEKRWNKPTNPNK